MSDRWAALKAWLDGERDKAGTAVSGATTALHALVGTTDAHEWNAASRASDEAHSRALALAEVARKMGELESGDGG